MRYLLFILMICLIPVQINAQAENNNRNKKKVYKVWIKQTDQKKSVKGYLGALESESIMYYRLDQLDKRNDLDVANIQFLEFRRENNIVRSALIGAGIGFVTGVILTAGDESQGCTPTLFNDCEDLNPMFGGLSFGILGGVIGGTVGIVKKKVRINGNLEQYQLNQEKLRAYLY